MTLEAQFIQKIREGVKEAKLGAEIDERAAADRARRDDPQFDAQVLERAKKHLTSAKAQERMQREERAAKESAEGRKPTSPKLKERSEDELEASVKERESLIEQLAEQKDKMQRELDRRHEEEWYFSLPDEPSAEISAEPPTDEYLEAGDDVDEDGFLIDQTETGEEAVE